MKLWNSRFRNHALRSLVLVGVSTVSFAQGLGDKPPMLLGQVRPAMDFTTLAENHRPTWDELKGKVVVIDFWASWCGPCIASFPAVNALQKQFAGKPVVFYSVSYETPAMVQKVLHKFPLETHIALDNDFRTFKSFQAWAIPAVYIFDAQGHLAAEVNARALNADLLNEVLAGRSPNVPQQNGWADPAGAESYFRSLRKEGEEAKP